VNDPAEHALPVAGAMVVVMAVALMITSIIFAAVRVDPRGGVVMPMIVCAMVSVWVSHLAQDARPAGRGTR
jgi:hypothetical protein